MLYDELLRTAVRDGWQLATVEHEALAVAAFIVAAVLIWDGSRTWKRTRRVEIELRKMEKKIYILEMQESGRLTRLVRELSAKSGVKVEARETGVEIADGADTAPTISPPATADRREIRKSTKLSCSRRRRAPSRKAIVQR
jgi:hypothetical protein